jgi:hypothetical protein
MMCVRRRKCHATDAGVDAGDGLSAHMIALDRMPGSSPPTAGSIPKPEPSRLPASASVVTAGSPRLDGVPYLAVQSGWGVDVQRIQARRDALMGTKTDGPRAGPSGCSRAAIGDRRASEHRPGTGRPGGRSWAID